jgi:hypothetical protein
LLENDDNHYIVFAALLNLSTKPKQVFVHTDLRFGPVNPHDHIAEVITKLRARLTLQVIVCEKISAAVLNISISSSYQITKVRLVCVAAFAIVSLIESEKY